MVHLYENIKRRRRELGLSQDELAQKVGYNGKSMISRIESGQIDLSQSTIEKFAIALETTPSILMGWIDIETNANDSFDKRMIEWIKNLNGELTQIGKDKLTSEELDLIFKFRMLDDRGKKTVTNTINEQYSYVDISKSTKISYRVDLD